MRLFCYLSIFPIYSCVLETRQLIFPSFPDAFNPSVLDVEEGILMAFRYLPDQREDWISYIGLVLLNEQFEPIQEPQLVATRGVDWLGWNRHGLSDTPSHSEDPRLFRYRGRIFVIFNDNREDLIPDYNYRRDMYIAEVLRSDRFFFLSSIQKIYFPEHYSTRLWQKNWIPFEWEKRLCFIYSIDPHIILELNWLDGRCYKLCETKGASLDWEYGPCRGGTIPLAIDEQYLSFFHSSLKMRSEASSGQLLWHYFMGAYTFSRSPPFAITTISSAPIQHSSFYTVSDCEKRVVFPAGYIERDSLLHVFYGKDDREIWVATLDKQGLYSEMKTVGACCDAGLLKQE